MSPLQLALVRELDKTRKRAGIEFRSRTYCQRITSKWFVYYVVRCGRWGRPWNFTGVRQLFLESKIRAKSWLPDVALKSRNSVRYHLSLSKPAFKSPKWYSKLFRSRILQVRRHVGAKELSGVAELTKCCEAPQIVKVFAELLIWLRKGRLRDAIWYQMDCS